MGEPQRLVEVPEKKRPGLPLSHCPECGGRMTLAYEHWPERNADGWRCWRCGRFFVEEEVSDG